MKLRTLPLAILLSSIAAPSFADVTIYGKVDLFAVGKTVTDASGATTSDVGMQVNSGGLASSRFGIKGSTKINSGLEGIWKYEGKVGADDGQLFGFQRNAWVGLKGGFGEFTAGLQWTPYDSGFYYVDVQEYGASSVQTQVLNKGVHGDAYNKSNALNYNSPKFGGLQMQVMYAPGEDGVAGGRDSSKYTGVRLSYDRGPVNLQFASDSDDTLPTGATALLNKKAQIIGGSYDAKRFKVFGAVNKASSTEGEDKGYSVGVSVPVGAKAKVRVAYAEEKTTGSATAANNATRDGFGLDLTYSIASNIDLYAISSQVNSQVTGATGSTTTKQMGVGILYNF